MKVVQPYPICHGPGSITIPSPLLILLLIISSAQAPAPLLVPMPMPSPAAILVIVITSVSDPTPSTLDSPLWMKKGAYNTLVGIFSHFPLTLSLFLLFLPFFLRQITCDCAGNGSTYGPKCSATVLVADETTSSGTNQSGSKVTGA